MLLASFSGSISVTSNPLASQLGIIEVTSDWPTFTLDVDARASVAFAQRFQRLGIRVDYDRGDGVMLTFPDRELAAESFVIDETADGFGDVLTFRVAGERFSPFAQQVLCAKTKIQVYFITGSPLNEFTTLVFTGWIVSSGYDVQPPSTAVTCLDAAGLYAEKRAKDWSLPPNSGRTRMSILTELLGIGGIPLRYADLGANGGGIVNKPHTLGDTPIVVWLRSFLVVLGCDVGFENGGFVAKRYDANLPPVLELNPSNLLIPLSISSPETLSPNVLGVVSVSVTRSELGGYTTEGPLSVVVTGPYAPDTAVEMIDGGVVTPTGLVPTEAVQIISESLTTITKYGGVAVRTEKVERGWMAERAAGAQVEQTVHPGPGVWEYDVDPVPGKVWVFPDGSTRAVPRETYRELSRTIITKGLDEQGRVITEREERNHWQVFRNALFKVVLDGATLTDEPPGAGGPLGDPVPVGDDGQGMTYGREVYGGLLFGLKRPNELTVKTYALNDAGEIVSETVAEYFHQLPAVRRRSVGAFGYGLDSRLYYAADEEGVESQFDFVLPWRGLRVTTKTYRVLDEDSYEMSVSVREGSKAPTVTTSDPIIGALPKPEKAEPTTSTQELRGTFKDLERIAMAGEEIDDVEHNEFVETSEEADVYAKHRARRASARTLTCSSPIEGLVHKFRMVRVNIPNASIDGLSFYVRAVRRDAMAFSQGITADRYSF